LLATIVLAWRLDAPKSVSKNIGEGANTTDLTLDENAVERNIKLLRLGLVPLGAYLLLTTTVHPWYVTMIIPFLTFLLPKVGETNWVGRFIWPWSVFSCTVVLSYLTYINPIKFQEYALVRHLEYLPFYLLLIWAGWPFFQRWINLVQRWIADRTR
jgi:hypothetical protein